MNRWQVTLEGGPIDGVDSANVEASDMDEALEAAMDELGRPLSGIDEGHITIRIGLVL